MEVLKIQIKEGWHLLKDDKKCVKIIKAILRNNGCCPCQPKHPECPCNKYLNENKCCCTLYEQDV